MHVILICFSLALYLGLSFYVFEKLKYISLDYLPNVCGKRHSGSSGGIVLTVPAKLLCGGLAGAVAQTVSYVHVSIRSFSLLFIFYVVSVATKIDCQKGLSVVFVVYSINLIRIY